MTDFLLQVRNLCVRFEDRDVVSNLDLNIAPGEKHALVGESGSGKTVTALALLQLCAHARVGGSALFVDSNDKPRNLIALTHQQIRLLRSREIAMVFQEPMTALNPLMTVGAQIAESVALKDDLKSMALKQAVLDLLGHTGITDVHRCARSYPHQISGGQRQRAMIAMALASRPRLLIADEPTTALDVSLREQIMNLLSNLQQESGMAILLITHDLKMVRRFAHNVTVLEHGKVVESGTVEQIFNNPAKPYTRSLVMLGAHKKSLIAPEPSTREALLQAQNLHVTYPVARPGFKGWFVKNRFLALESATFSLQAGQTLGVIGESGSGKSTLAQAVLGLLPFGGTVTINGRGWIGKSAQVRSLRRIAQMVFQDPFSSLSPRMTVETIVGEGLRVHQPNLTRAQRTQAVCACLEETGLPIERFEDILGRYPHEFSGGQRQRIALARALILSPSLLILDEPTSALDVAIQEQILELLKHLQKTKNLAYLLITHDVDVVRALAHFVLVLKDGKVVEQGSAQQVLAQPQHPYTQQLLEAAS